MSSFSSGLPDALRAAGPVLGFLISLAIGSYLIRDNFLARLAQYVLVGAGLGYLAVLVWRNVLWPRLFAPLVADPLSWLSLQEPGFFQSLLPLLLGLLMWVGGVDLLFRPPQKRSWRRILRLLAVIPAAILGGVGLGVGLSGALQGTVLPQLSAALASPQAATLTAPDSGAAVGQTMWLLRFLTLLITGGVLIHLHTGRADDTDKARRAPTPASRVHQSEISAEGLAVLRSALIGRLMAVWEGVGRRALWLAAGIIFARLIAARFALVLARLDYFLFEIPRLELWQLLLAALRGGGP